MAWIYSCVIYLIDKKKKKKYSNGQETVDPAPKVSMVFNFIPSQSYMGFYENNKFKILINETVNKN